MRLVEQARSRGAIHTVFHEGDDLTRPEMGICNCCWDCCEFLSLHNKAGVSLTVRAHHVAVLSAPTACDRCAKCAEHCPTAAIRVDAASISLDADKCVGCGQCAFRCPRDVFTLAPSHRDVHLPWKSRDAARVPPVATPA